MNPICSAWATPGLEIRERLSVEEVGRVDDVPGAPHLIGERGDAGREAERVMEQHHFTHRRSSSSDRSAGNAGYGARPTSSAAAPAAAARTLGA